MKNGEKIIKNSEKLKKKERNHENEKVIKNEEKSWENGKKSWKINLGNVHWQLVSGNCHLGFVHFDKKYIWEMSIQEHAFQVLTMNPGSLLVDFCTKFF